MTLDDLYKLAEEKLPLDLTSLDVESARIPELFNTFSKLFHDLRVKRKALKLTHTILYKDKWEYYSGRMSQQDLQSRKWTPFPHKILRPDLEIYMNADADLLTSQAKIDYMDEQIDFLESICKSIAQRQWTIRNAIEWKKFLAGSV